MVRRGGRWHRPRACGSAGRPSSNGWSRSPASSRSPPARRSRSRASRRRSRAGCRPRSAGHRRLVRRRGGAAAAGRDARRSAARAPRRATSADRAGSTLPSCGSRARARATTAATGSTAARPPATPPSSRHARDLRDRRLVVVGRREPRAHPRLVPRRRAPLLQGGRASEAGSPTAITRCAARSSARPSHRLALLLERARGAGSSPPASWGSPSAKRTARMRLCGATRPATHAMSVIGVERLAAPRRPPPAPRREASSGRADDGGVGDRRMRRPAAPRAPRAPPGGR